MIGDRSLDATLDFVDNLGADPDGTNLSDDALAALNTLRGDIRVLVPEGRYRFSGEEHTITTPRRNGMRVFDSHPHTSPEFFAPGDYDGPWMTFETNGAFRGINIDRTTTGANPRIRVESTDRFEIADCRVIGRDNSTADSLDDGMFTLIGEQDTSTVSLSNVQLQAGATITGFGGNRAGIEIPAANQGTVTLDRCRIEECAGHGVDAAYSRGPLVVSGGTYRNNNRSQIRFCGPESRVDDATVVVDLEGSAIPADQYARTAGIWDEAMREADEKRAPSGGEISETTIRVASGPPERLAGAFYGTPLAGGVRLRRCDLVVDPDDVPAVDVSAPEAVINHPPPEPPHGIVLDRVACRGQSASGTAVSIAGRGGTALTKCCISLPNERVAHDLPSGAQVTRLNTQGGCTGPPR